MSEEMRMGSASRRCRSGAALVVGGVIEDSRDMRRSIWLMPLVSLVLALGGCFSIGETTEGPPGPSGAEGSLGPTGASSLIAVDPTTSSCPRGGVTIYAGTDDDADGILSPSERDISQEVCALEPAWTREDGAACEEEDLLVRRPGGWACVPRLNRVSFVPDVDMAPTCDLTRLGRVFFDKPANGLCFCGNSGWVLVEDRATPCGTGQ